ncbi:hypothetical protein N7490_006129 [Penicillium lividum]|nr:hypothetical protein N7490_006129 [Penicillium lividum]
MPPFPPNFVPVFIRNQFRTNLELPNRKTFPSAEGKCAVITGANTGLGFESARQLLSLGLSHLVIAVRSLEKGTEAAAKLQAGSSAKVDVWQLDMESYKSIETFVSRCQQDLAKIDFVILNAGISPVYFTTAATGHEKAIQVNHFSTVLLAVLLLPVLKSKSVDGNTPHLTVVNSVMAHLCSFPSRNMRPLLSSLDDTDVTPWDPMDRYGVSKLLCQLFIVRLAGKVSPDDVIISMVEPGLTKGTSLARDARGLMKIGAKVFNGIAGRPVEKGAATYVDAILRHGKDSHGCFIMNFQNAPLAGLFYSEGEVLMDQVWEETLQELEFAGIERILASMDRFPGSQI